MSATLRYGVLSVWFVVFGISVPAVVFAAADAPQKDPLCWSQEACAIQYKSAGWCNDKSASCDKIVNWIHDASAQAKCGTWGFCVPPGKAQLSIAFNGKTEVKDIGQYIKLVYNYLVGIAGLIAAILIIKGGFEYMSAGGSSERMTSAKNTVGAAVFGLLLVLASFTLLNVVNPDLVHLRLPNVYMVRHVTLGQDLCKDVGTEKKFAEANVSYADVLKLPDNWNVAKPDTQCNTDYWIPDSDGKMCKGQSCEGKCSGQTPCTCIPSSDKATTDKQKFVCDQVSIGGMINFVDEKYLDDIWLKVLCADGSVEDIDHKGKGNYPSGQRYNFGHFLHNNVGWNVPEFGSKQCGGDKNVKGYFFIVEANDTGLGNQDDQWAGGKSLCASSSCPWFGMNQVNSSDAHDWMEKVLPNNVDGILFTQDEMKKGITCDLNITPSAFPNVSRTQVSFPCGLGSTFPSPK